MEHMNAVPLKPNKKQFILNSSDYIVEEKLKGIRAFLTFTNKGAVLQSRGGHCISHRFPHLAEIVIPELTGLTLDGELFQRGVPDEVIAGWGNHRTKNIDPGITKDVNFMCFDFFDEGLKLHTRKKLMHDFFNGIHPSSQIIELPYYSIDQAEQRFEDILAEGGEGIMLKNLNSMYIPGKRLEGIWYKLKGEEDFDVVITGFEMAEEYSIKKGDTEATETKFKGLIGAFRYGMYDATQDSTVEFGRDFMRLVNLGTCSGMTDDIRRHMTLHPEHYLHQVAEIKGVAQEKSGAIENPRYVRIRTDKRKEECVWVR